MNVCSFTIAVNRKHRSENQPEADFFRISAWRQLAEICNKYLMKGKKVAVIGTVSASAYTANDGTARANLEVQADDVEFLSPKDDPEKAEDPQTGNDFVQVDDEDLPFDK